MPGIIIILGLSWALLHFTIGKSLSILGYTPIFQRLKELVTGFWLAAILCLCCQLFEAQLGGYEWGVNPNIELGTLIHAFWWDFRSVLTEELIFRGALLYWLIHKTTDKRGILMSSLAFGLYHWFSMGLFGQVMPMIIVFTGTALIGAVWAYAFVKTKSIFLPLGLHFGWNFTLNTLFSKGPSGTLLLVQSQPPQLGDWVSLLFLSTWLLLVPLLLYIYCRYIINVAPHTITYDEEYWIL